MIGSTANIVALGLMEKHLDYKMTFMQWFKMGSVIGFISLLVAFGLVYFRTLLFY